ncbi:hypothetical protein [Fodinicola acaciae]|uniref:hypothetical protein n=1 Tax=Fodinicola acaciae TaxID=2681555 RepID=UPI0013D3DF9A|nr:hypothetical protein [Fodinicola acaciae]
MIVVYVAVAVLAVAVCVLFAMVGELATRVLAPSELQRGGAAAETAVIDGVSIGTEVSALPPTVGGPPADVEAPTDAGVLVLSTICTSCDAFARTLARSAKAEKLPGPLSVVISAPTAETAERFLSETGLKHVRTIAARFDQRGQWCREVLGVNTSPAFVRIVGGRVAKGWSLSAFTAIPALWEQARTEASQQKGERNVPANP